MNGVHLRYGCYYPCPVALGDASWIGSVQYLGSINGNCSFSLTSKYFWGKITFLRASLVQLFFSTCNINTTLYQAQDWFVVLQSKSKYRTNIWSYLPFIRSRENNNAGSRSGSPSEWLFGVFSGVFMSGRLYGVMKLAVEKILASLFAFEGVFTHM